MCTHTCLVAARGGHHFFPDSTRGEAICAADDEDDESDRECERGGRGATVVDGDDDFRAITARGNNA